MNTRFTLFVFLLITCYRVNAQEYIYISADGLRKVMRFNVGYTNFSITPKDSATKSANGIHLNNEVKIISAFIGNKSDFTIHDAFYFDINLGWMSQKPQVYKTETESKFSVCTNMGYLFMAGYRVHKWGALAGIDFRWRQASVGGLDMPTLNGDLMYFSRPFILRGEYNFSAVDNKRLIGTFWYDGGNGTSRAPYQSVRLEMALGDSERWWLLAQYTHQKAQGENTFMIQPPTEVSFNQFTVGVRLGYLP
jgi:hypothetical protein